MTAPLPSLRVSGADQVRSRDEGASEGELLEKARATLVALAPSLRGSLSAAEADALAVSLLRSPV